MSVAIRLQQLTATKKPISKRKQSLKDFKIRHEQYLLKNPPKSTKYTGPIKLGRVATKKQSKEDLMRDLANKYNEEIDELTVIPIFNDKNIPLNIYVKHLDELLVKYQALHDKIKEYLESKYSNYLNYTKFDHYINTLERYLAKVDKKLKLQELEKQELEKQELEKQKLIEQELEKSNLIKQYQTELDTHLAKPVSRRITKFDRDKHIEYLEKHLKDTDILRIKLKPYMRKLQNYDKLRLNRTDAYITINRYKNK
jgi:hypothetical protein